ncbi:MAG: tetratricopeptide repeat protein [Bacteroidetes bacterium]|jgi:tetratricopeptide (TPR) repeat protein|nr:tetratricopeptide repeat protein [Bacteroidota bacterium]
MLEDIRRYRKNLPVSARPEDSLYRSKKFIQRNRTIVASAVTVLVVLIASLIYSQNQARTAERERESAQQGFEIIQDLSGTLIFDIYDNISELPGSTPSRKIIVEKALVYLDQLAANTTPDENLHLYLAEAYRKIGDVQGNPTNANLGLHREALESYQTSLNYLAPLVENDAENLSARESLAMLHGRMSDVYRTLGNLAESREQMTQSLKQYDDLRNEAPDKPHILRSYALANIKMGDLMGNPNFTSLEMPVIALDYYAESEEILKPLFASNPDDVFNIRLLGLVFERFGDIYSYQGSYDEAAEYFEDSMELRKKLAEMDPSNSEALRDEAIAYEKLADVHQQNGNLNEALRNYSMSMEIFTRLAAIDPRNVQAQQSLAISYLHLGDLHYHTENFSFQNPEKALTFFNQSYEILQNVYDTDGSNIRTERLISILERRKDMIASL